MWQHYSSRWKQHVDWATIINPVHLNLVYGIKHVKLRKVWVYYLYVHVHTCTIFTIYDIVLSIHTVTPLEVCDIEFVHPKNRKSKTGNGEDPMQPCAWTKKAHADNARPQDNAIRKENCMKQYVINYTLYLMFAFSLLLEMRGAQVNYWQILVLMPEHPRNHLTSP